MNSFLDSTIENNFKFTWAIRNKLKKYIKDCKVNFTIIKFTKMNPIQ
jgi:hypothetical protein|uniref:Uncharacterized protein n=1 Tax=viral metagenome TaxID=1070528 RepID=A0A6C0EEH6_9ZZZZ